MHGISSPSTTDPLNLSDAINVAEKFQVHLWVKICKEELINRFKSLQHPEIMSLPLAAVTEILKSDDLEVRSEDDVYKFTLEWALRNYRTKQQRHKVMESELGSLIRFHYMSNDMLVHCNTNYDEFFSMQFIREILRTAINDKQKVPERHFVERAYKHKPLMVSEVLEPRRSCTIWLTFTKDECLRLVRSSPVRSMDFDFHDGRFFIQVAAARDGRFLLSLEVVCLPSHDYFLCTAASKAKGDGEYVGIHSWEFGLRTQDSGLYQDLFGTPLSEFLRDDSSYFNDGKLHLQVKIEAIQQPRFRIRMNWLRSQTNNL
ncbi:BTB/POZ domain-containing protein At2g46260-like [Typha latifolia]|uniref:BTB/POZ domain-containing protein At2g46260-like n=1 Tax=Typha latifolia TaxID=4733 RepID=UPI003C2ED855